MATAIIKLDPLPDAIRAGAKDHYLARVGRRGFVFRFVRRVEIWCERFKLRAARINSFVDGSDPAALAILAYFVLGAPGQISETAIGKPHLFERMKCGR